MFQQLHGVERRLVPDGLSTKAQGQTSQQDAAWGFVTEAHNTKAALLHKLGHVC
jgi:hypothetical protein